MQYLIILVLPNIYSITGKYRRIGSVGYLVISKMAVDCSNSFHSSGTGNRDFRLFVRYNLQTLFNILAF